MEQVVLPKPVEQQVHTCAAGKSEGRNNRCAYHPGHVDEARADVTEIFLSTSEGCIVVSPLCDVAPTDEHMPLCKVVTFQQALEILGRQANRTVDEGAHDCHLDCPTPELSWVVRPSLIVWVNDPLLDGTVEVVHPAAIALLASTFDDELKQPIWPSCSGRIGPLALGELSVMIVKVDHVAERFLEDVLPRGRSGTAEDALPTRGPRVHASRLPILARIRRHLIRVRSC